MLHIQMHAFTLIYCFSLCPKIALALLHTLFATLFISYFKEYVKKKARIQKGNKIFICYCNTKCAAELTSKIAKCNETDQSASLARIRRPHHICCNVLTGQAA